MHLAVLESFVQKMGSMFAYQSSEVDWCEENYKYSDHVAEFYNTVSNVGFFICAPLMMYLQHPYARERTLAVHLFWLMLIIVGVFSAYYHMTLSYIGQMLDEISILWIIAVAYAIWYPRVHFPNFIKNRHHFITMVFITASVSTLVIFMKPIMNAYILNCTTFHVLYTLKLELKKHIFITITVVHSTALFTYFDAMYEIPECLPEVQYWPCNSWLLGLPYLAVQSSRKLKKDC
ncbi:alkaline ceramidase 1 isoform X2 [Rhinatrema bivittatum]|uniref:alkaline ceramidase 1 isoform X2 n=1 Tax=Rhinatrema bivittatum TaxID=194408 RepID=UPI001128F7F3|nr:alkaline ceramidase 1 isoform X2 [Rhinatrema bivittatum]